MNPGGTLMSDILNYLRSSLEEYVRDGDVNRFREEFAGAYLYIRNNPKREAEANKLASAIVGPLGEFSGGYLSEREFRSALASIGVSGSEMGLISDRVPDGRTQNWAIDGHR